MPGKCRHAASRSLQPSGDRENNTVTGKRHMTMALKIRFRGKILGSEHFFNFVELVFDARFGRRIRFCHEDQFHGDEKYAGLQENVVSKAINEQCYGEQAEGKHDYYNCPRV